MTFRYEDRHQDEFLRDGFTVFRGILPPALVRDLRRETEKGRESARNASGSQVQRFQPVGAYDLDRKPFEAYRDLPELRDALARVLSPRHTYGDLDRWLGVLIEPASLPWCTNWHRDFRHHTTGEKRAAWERVRFDLDYFNQINCALYADDSTWVVPGSHLREDLPCERAAFPDDPPAGPSLDGWGAEEREAACLRYANSMPGAVQLFLQAGDFCLYRSGMWHLGNYLPYRRRATLHDAVETPRSRTWLLETGHRAPGDKPRAEQAASSALVREAIPT